MQDSIISVRMPESLFNELKEAAEKNHYMDLSEAVRNLIRRKITEQQATQIGQGQTRRELINGLQRLIDQLENGAQQEQ